MHGYQRSVHHLRMMKAAILLWKKAIRVWKTAILMWKHCSSLIIHGLHTMLQCHHQVQSLKALLPLFHVAHSPAMICQAFDVIRSAVQNLNPGQVPVLTTDQPLYAIGKLAQRNWHDKYGEIQFALMLGGLHTETAALKALGDFLDGSGWTTVLTNAGVTSTGRADSIIHASHNAVCMLIR